jgi:UDPglucose 6-dehydrogenase/GDP-mannose 6-dehydrogenase
MMNISVIGTGYVGLVSGVCLAAKGHTVTCVDVDATKVERINRAAPPIFERGLKELLGKTVGSSLFATTNLREAVMQSALSIIAVGTPFNGDEIDLTYIRTVAQQIGEILRDKPDYHVVVVKSTVVPGTTDEVVKPILERASGKTAGRDFGVGMNPEFLREGEAIDDFMNPDRIVLGGIDARTQEALAQVYAAFPEVDKLKTSNKTAEMIKYTANALLATMISFSNEIGNLCATLGDIDVVDVMQGVHLDKRLSPILPDGSRIKPSFTTYLEAGCGFGGSCFPKDVKALIAHGNKMGSPMPLLEAVITVNTQQPKQVLGLLEKHFPNLKARRIAILGLAFKPETDDMRESPAIPIVQHLLRQGASVKAYDPIAAHEARKIFGNGQIDYSETLPAAIEGAEAIVLLTRWQEFHALPHHLKNLSPQPLVIDGRRMLDKTQIARYEGIGLRQ